MKLRGTNPDSNSFLYLERYVNDGSPSGFSAKFTTSEKTSPFSQNESFHLCSIELPNTIKILNFGNEPDFFKKWQMLVHPDMIENPLFSICTKIDHMSAVVAPTASGRTVKMLDGEGWFLKLNYMGLIGRIDRQLGADQACSAIEVSREIEKAIVENRLPKFFSFFRELFGRVVKMPCNGSLYDWGIVLREPFPYSATSYKGLLIPGFSLFSKDRNVPSQETVLIQLASAQNKKIEDFLFEDIIAPIYDCYFGLLTSCGLQLEAQAQNILLMVDSDFRVVSIVARDAESIDKDISLMSDLGISNNYTTSGYKCLYRGQYNYQIMHSFMFDFKLGEYLISPIIQEAARHFKIIVSDLQQRIRSYNQKYIHKLPHDFFPSDGNWYSYANIVHNRGIERPYISNSNPKYR